MKKPVVLIILDGWGYREETKDNAIAAAQTPHFDELWNKYPHGLLAASGAAVGLPEGQMGNSEVGHTTIGAGAALPTELVRISAAAQNGEFIKNPAFQKLFDHVKTNHSTLHLLGLLGKGGVHSHQDHLIAFLKTAKEAGISQVALHLFTDGRDTPPQSAASYLKELEQVMAFTGLGFIASLSGRLYAMDRDNNWERVNKAAEAIFNCEGNKCALKQPSVYLESLYPSGIMDEKLEPLVFSDENGQTYKLQSGDGVFFFNFRSDRARMLSTKIAEQASKANLCFVTMTEYEPSLPALVAFPPISPQTTLAKEISAAGLTQAHIAETEKFAHATYFLNGGVEKPYAKEIHDLIPSQKVLTHDLAPEMRAKEIAEKAVERINEGNNFIFINFANADMVGHTANVPAIIKGLEAADAALGQVIEAVESKSGVAIITADHGNAEINRDPITGEPHTAHTSNPVPVIITDEQVKIKTNGTLADLAPTVLTYLDLSQPDSMTGHSLLHG